MSSPTGTTEAARDEHDRPRSLQELNAVIVATPPPFSGAGRAVLGEGKIGARLSLIGEQPGDREEREGRPFVGPAGALLAKALGEAGIDRSDCYVTNAVKHFKHEARGKRRLHQTPTRAEIRHYRWWLELELEFVGSAVVVAMGRSAAFALLDREVSIARMRGPTSFGDRKGFITVHPSSLLRQRSAPDWRQRYGAFVSDLAAAARAAGP